MLTKYYIQMASLQYNKHAIVKIVNYNITITSTAPYV